MAINKKVKRLVVKVGTSTLTLENGKPDIRKIEKLVRILSDLQNKGVEIILVSSGAIGLGMGKIGLTERPVSTRERQALAAVGQCEMMFLYDKLFSEYTNTVAQILLTRANVDIPNQRENVINTLNTLIENKIIPIINENDTVAIDEIKGNNFGDNDMLSAIVAKLVGADLLILITDIDGLYNSNPRENPNAEKIDTVDEITDEICSYAGGSGSKRGTGGMVTKLEAAKTATAGNTDVVIMSGEKLSRIYDILEGQSIGTHFRSKESTK